MKKNAKLIWIGAICAVVLVIGILVLVLCMEQDSDPKITMTKDQALQQLNTALAAADSSPDEGAPAFLEELDNRNGYEILNLTEQEQTYVVTVRVYAPDVYSVAHKLDAEEGDFTAEELADRILTEMKTCAIAEKEVQIEYHLQDEQYVPVLTEEFVDAYYGGVLQLYEEAFEMLIGGEETAQ